MNRSPVLKDTGRNGFYLSLKSLYSFRSLCPGQTFDVLWPNIFVCAQFVHYCSRAQAMLTDNGFWSAKQIMSFKVMLGLMYYKWDLLLPCLKAYRISVFPLLKNRLSLVKVKAFSAASAFHKKLTAPHKCNGMSNSDSLNWVLSYVRGGPYPEQDVMPAQAWALLFGQFCLFSLVSHRHTSHRRWVWWSPRRHCGIHLKTIWFPHLPLHSNYSS